MSNEIPLGEYLEQQEVRDRLATAEWSRTVKAIDPAWFESPPIPRPWIVRVDDRGIIAPGAMHLLAGEGGVGKGRFAMQLAVAIASGATSTPHGFNVDGKAGKVLLVLGEDDIHEVHSRVHAARSAAGVVDDNALARNLHFRCCHGLADVLVRAEREDVVGTSTLRALIAYLNANGPWRMIVVDPFARFVAVPENANDAVHRAMCALEELTKVNGNPAVVVCTHARKPSGESSSRGQHEVRGASALVNAVRVVLWLRPSEAGVSFEVTKNNLSAKIGEMALSFTRDGALRSSQAAPATKARRRDYQDG